ncbi:Rp1-like protein [Rhynchospora pubera]|uniref:Rp1-like protein n=1 Tax=Rhynchospora pubera TaxID=906938 RepID=A0AAV8C918_9POAL|nr:Rp1-like protein [Rhynchospora pubera]
MTGAEAAGLAALGWVASPVIKEIVSKGISYLGSDIAEGLEDLETTLLPQFQLTIQAAHNSPHKDKLAKWLARLKSAYYDAETILHELEYEHLKSMVKADSKKLGEGSLSFSHPSMKPFATAAKVANKVNKKASPVTKPLANVARKVSEKISILSPQKKKLLENLHNLKKIADEAKVFRELLNINSKNENDAPSSNRNSENTSLLTHKVFGRDEVRDQIINILLDEQGGSRSNQSNSVVAIIGMGGAGKTTLAQYVYNNERVKNNFGVRVWLSLSENKDVKECTRMMIEGVTGQESPNLLSLNTLHTKLVKSLSEVKSILLVLDDVWYDQKTEQQWDNLLAPFSSTGGQCKIMVTSRKTLFPNALSRRKPITIKLSELAHDDFKSLFRYYAMDGLEAKDPHLKNDLCEIGDEITTKMIKSPLAAQVVGNQLQKCPEKSFWRDTLKSDILSSTREVLLWSYQHLDVQLQRCFLFDSVFNKESYVHSGNELVYYWMALDFIQSSDIGYQYFNTMVANSMLQLVDGKYYMHDLFRDLAENLSVGDCFRVTNFENEIPSNALYALIKVNDESWTKNLSSICDSRNLRALILDVLDNPLEKQDKLLPMVCTKFKNLRVLEVWSWDLKELPSIIGDLKNLRYLDVWHSSIKELPNSVTRLYHLQFLLLPTSIKTLPPTLSDLIKLRSIVKYDRNYNPVHSLPPIPYLGKLTSLQRLSEFHVRKEEGHELFQLATLNEITGSLRIVNLNNVRQKNEARAARLFEKSKLKGLELVWVESSENGFDSEVIEALQPAEGLEYLSIEGYGGSRCPSWLLKGFFLKNITYLKFYNCSALADLPENFHQLCPYLTQLRVNKCPCLIFVCENEIQLNDTEGTMVDKSWLYNVMHSELEFKNVFHQEVQSFKKIDLEQNCGEKLKIIKRATEDVPLEFFIDAHEAWWQCHQQRMNFIFRCKTVTMKLLLPSNLHVLFISFCSISDGALSVCLRGTVTLKELYLEGIMTITTLPPVEVLNDLQSLRVLTIKNCWCLRSLGGLHGLPTLESFILDTCWNFKMKSDYIELPLTLQTFIIQVCGVSRFLLLDNLQFLRHIEIKSSIDLTDLSIGHLTSLKYLNLFDCSRLHHIQSLVPPSSFIDTLSLVRLPNLDVKSVLKTWKGCRELYISSSAILNELQLTEYFDAIQTLIIEWCDEDTISFEKSNHLRSIKTLGFYNCELKHLPSTLSDFSNLESIYFYRCSRILSLPELPTSLQEIQIEDCQELQCLFALCNWHCRISIQSQPSVSSAASDPSRLCSFVASDGFDPVLCVR